MSVNSPADLQRIYAARFSADADYRQRVWRVLIERFFQAYVRADAVVLDLGCGYGEFINQVGCGSKFAMDLNPDAPRRLAPQVKCLLQDCSARWPLEDASLDVVFTSNFFEHLPDKSSLGRTLDEIHRCLKPGGRLVAMGPNIKYLPGAYWDFWDHYIPLTETSLQEALENRAFRIEKCVARFLPYTMASGPRYPLFFLSLYLALSPFWRFFGKQFLVIATK
jgi:SAM-dependent methyltransferase